MSKAEYFNACAGEWDRCPPPPPQIIDWILNLCRVGPGMTVLDLGSGTGILLEPLLQRVGDRGRVWAVDIAPAMIEIARRKHADPRVTFRVGAAESLPLPDRSCHRVVCFRAFPHFSDKRQALREMGRVLRPGGWLIIGHVESRRQVNQVHLDVGGEVAHDHLPTPAQLASMAADAGLIPLSCWDGPAFAFLARQGEGSNGQ